ncbi:putative capsid protein [Pseudomonas phage PhiPA3]|uniref:Putative capsid protein n=1 Tax=Pseudomonas phage PhiPA3 TaxID=998086 RepID=F8SJJ1_BPPA3|nr:putative capsid protein [Pseudomonas phage PhiPA3]AEH03782.1 putative capsid protein [Pseudomonas phage PhiPA3]
MSLLPRSDAERFSPQVYPEERAVFIATAASTNHLVPWGEGQSFYPIVRSLVNNAVELTSDFQLIEFHRLLPSCLRA